MSPVIVCPVGEPNSPVTITSDELRDLNQKLSFMRHEINNQLALVIAALELIRFRPDLRDKMLDTVAAQSPKITATVMKFSSEFETAFGITHE